jgi:protein phosphatase 1 regulatory subunit 37
VALVEVLQAGITYIAQVLKRNRTLKVLNLSENKLEVAGLVAIAEGLVRLNVRCMNFSLIRNPL